MSALGLLPRLTSMNEELPVQRVEVGFVGTPPIRAIERPAGVSEVEVDGAALRCVVLGSFQPFLEALRGHEVISLTSTPTSASSEPSTRNAPAARLGQPNPHQRNDARGVNRMRSITRFPCGRWTKWAVLAAWLVVFVVAGPLAGKLKDVEKNDPADALPKGAESTRVVDLARRFTPSGTVPALVVYERGGAAGAADHAKVAGDVRRFAG